MPVSVHFFQVYQYMHETITVNGCPEYQARATAKVRAAFEARLQYNELNTLNVTRESCN